MIGLHVGISLFLYVVGFNYSMIALLVLLMPPIFYDALERIGKSFFRNCSVVVRAIWERSRPLLRFLISSFVIVQIVLLCVDSTFTLCRGLGTVSKGKKHCPGLGDLRGVPNPLGKYSSLLREWLSVVHGGYQTHHPFAYVVFTRSLTHSLTLSNTNQPTNQPTGTEVESSRVLTTFLLGQTKTISLPCMIIAKWYHSKRRHLFGIPIFGNRNIRQINSKTSSRVLQREISMCLVCSNISVVVLMSKLWVM